MDGGSGLLVVVDIIFLIVFYGYMVELVFFGLFKGIKYRVKCFMRVGV